MTSKDLRAFAFLAGYMSKSAYAAGQDLNAKARPASYKTPDSYKTPSNATDPTTPLIQPVPFTNPATSQRNTQVVPNAFQKTTLQSPVKAQTQASNKESDTLKTQEFKAAPVNAATGFKDMPS